MIAVFEKSKSVKSIDKFKTFDYETDDGDKLVIIVSEELLINMSMTYNSFILQPHNPYAVTTNISSFTALLKDHDIEPTDGFVYNTSIFNKLPYELGLIKLLVFTTELELPEDDTEVTEFTELRALCLKINSLYSVQSNVARRLYPYNTNLKEIMPFAIEYPDDSQTKVEVVLSLLLNGTKKKATKVIEEEEEEEEEVEEEDEDLSTEGEPAVVISGLDDLLSMFDEPSTPPSTQTQQPTQTTLDEDDDKELSTEEKDKEEYERIIMNYI